MVLDSRGGIRDPLNIRRRTRRNHGYLSHPSLYQEAGNEMISIPFLERRQPAGSISCRCAQTNRPLPTRAPYTNTQYQLYYFSPVKERMIKKMWIKGGVCVQFNSGDGLRQR